MTTTTDTTRATDTTDTATVEPQPAVTPETATVDTETLETPEASPEAGTDDIEDQDDDAGGKGNREAAKYRRRLRDVEAERDRLKATVAALQRAEVDRLATDAGLRPAALWANGAEVGELLGDDGTVDAARVSAAVAVAREQLGIPNPPPRGNYVKGEGRSPGRPPKPSGLDAMVGAVMGRDGRDG